MSKLNNVGQPVTLPWTDTSHFRNRITDRQVWFASLTWIGVVILCELPGGEDVKHHGRMYEYPS